MAERDDVKAAPSATAPLGFGFGGLEHSTFLREHEARMRRVDEAIAEVRAKAAHWKNCHDGQVATKRRLSRAYGEMVRHRDRLQAVAEELARAINALSGGARKVRGQDRYTVEAAALRGARELLKQYPALTYIPAEANAEADNPKDTP
jgi:hypothetical protein